MEGIVGTQMAEVSTRPIDKLPADVRVFFDATMGLLGTYMPGTTKIEMLVGRNVTAELKIVGGPITREVIEDTMAHLAFYKKYFPKDGEDDGHLDSPEKIIKAMTSAWAEHRAAIDQSVAEQI
jgi:hypothetical protein